MFLSSPKNSCRDEIGTVSLFLNQISSTGAEIEGKQSPSHHHPTPLTSHPRPCLLPLSYLAPTGLTLSFCRTLLRLPTFFWTQLPDSTWG